MTSNVLLAALMFASPIVDSNSAATPRVHLGNGVYMIGYAYPCNTVVLEYVPVIAYGDDATCFESVAFPPPDGDKHFDWWEYEYNEPSRSFRRTFTIPCDMPWGSSMTGIVHFDGGLGVELFATYTLTLP